MIDVKELPLDVLAEASRELRLRDVRAILARLPDPTGKFYYRRVPVDELSREELMKVLVDFYERMHRRSESSLGDMIPFDFDYEVKKP
jgi:hypothetical protein